MTDPGLTLPEAAERRLASGSFSSGLSVSDFASCLEMGLRPVGLVQGFCVMQWGWYGAGSPYMRGLNPYSPAASYGSGYIENYGCPHGFVSSEHRTWGQNYEQPWVESTWAQGFGNAYDRMLSEAKELGAHGIIGVTNRTQLMTDVAVTEFHLLGTAVVVEDGPAPGGAPWATYLAGQRLGKLFQAGFAPVSIAAAFTSVRIWANCVTAYLMEGGMYAWASNGPHEVVQVESAHTAVRELARERVRAQLGGDLLHGANMELHRRELGEGDAVVECTLSGTRVRRFKEFDPIPPANPTVRLS
jgi:hypothetical protein